MSITAAIICAVVYAVINWLDPYTLSWQCLNRPIVVAPLVGLLLGDFQTGIIMGASLEAIFMGISAVGGSIPSDCLSGSIIAVAYAIVVGGDGAMETGLALSLTIRYRDDHHQYHADASVGRPGSLLGETGF